MINHLFLVIWSFFYSLGFKVPFIFALLFIGVNAKIPKRKALLLIIPFILYLHVILSTIQIGAFYNWILLLDPIILVVLIQKKKFSKSNYLFVAISMLLLSLTQELNDNFSGWLALLSYLSIMKLGLTRRSAFIVSIIYGSFCVFVLGANTAAIVIFLFPVILRLFSLKSFLIYYILVFVACFYVTLYYHDESFFVLTQQTLPSFSIRFIMWVNTLSNLSPTDLLFGNEMYLNNSFNSVGSGLIESPFYYEGNSSHNVIVDLISKYGIVFSLFAVLISFKQLKRYKNILVPILIYWFFEPGLGSFQLSSLILLYSGTLLVKPQKHFK